MKKVVAVDRHLLAKEIIKLVYSAMIDLSERESDSFVKMRLDNMSYILSSAHDILEEFADVAKEPGILIHRDYERDYKIKKQFD